VIGNPRPQSGARELPDVDGKLNSHGRASAQSIVRNAHQQRRGSTHRNFVGGRPQFDGECADSHLGAVPEHNRSCRQQDPECDRGENIFLDPSDSATNAEPRSDYEADEASMGCTQAPAGGRNESG
jgi:hypothetical protein